MIRTVAVVLALVLHATVSAKDVLKQAKVRWTYTITPAAETETIQFRCLVPRDRDAWQRVTHLQFSHAPVERISADQDALARFFFRNLKAPITLTIDASVELRSASLIARRPAAGNKLTDGNRVRFTSPERYIESDSPQVVALAERSGGGTIPQQLIGIQKCVEEVLARGEFDPLDHGAVAAIERGKGDCSEHADLFVAICRAKKIPAVVCEGFTIDAGLWKRKPPHHTWVMVWLEDRGWTRFDPLDVSSRLARHEAQSSWYIHLTDQRINDHLNGHLYRLDWTGAEAKVEWRFEVVE